MNIIKQARKLRSTKLTVIPVLFTSRYSNTMEDDKMGRWARVVYAGDFPGCSDKICHWQIGWISKHKDKDNVWSGKFYISLEFPNSVDRFHDTLEGAETAIRESFKWFINNCIIK